MLYQAGTSSRGQSFAARHAECVFMSAPSKSILKRSVDELRAALVTAGREANDALIYGQMLIITGTTEAAAQAKHVEYLEHINMDAALRLLSGWTGVDFSQIDPDATIEYIENDAGRTALASFSKADPSRKWTVREAAKFIGLGGAARSLPVRPRKWRISLRRGATRPASMVSISRLPSCRKRSATWLN